MKSLVLALQFMTRLPLPDVAADRMQFGRAIRWFPVAGLVVGASVAAALALGRLLDPALAGLLGLAAWAGITGALHLDGLGDMADAAGATHADAKRLSEVLADPHIGSFGVVAVVLQLLAKFVLLTLLATRAGAGTEFLWQVPLLGAVLGRIGPIVWTLVLPPLHQGLGTLFREGAGWSHLAAWLALWCLAAALTIPALLLALAVLPLWALWVRSRIGGISGDGHGAGIELVETACLLLAVCAA